MRKSMLLAALLAASCGYSSQGNRLVGQVKKVIEKTPIICGDYVEADLSLGVFRSNGVGSMSHEDLILYVPNRDDAALLNKAQDTGQLVEVTYDIKRVVICNPQERVTSVKLVDEQAPQPPNAPTTAPTPTTAQ